MGTSSEWVTCDLWFLTSHEDGPDPNAFKPKTLPKL